MLTAQLGRAARDVDGAWIWPVLREDCRMATVARSRPRVVCLCGSTRFLDAFDDASLQQTLAGNIVLSVATTRTRDKDLFAGRSEEEQAVLRDQLATLHRAKIDLADEILVINVGGYIGPSTRSEIEYADGAGKLVTYLEQVDAVI